MEDVRPRFALNTTVNPAAGPSTSIDSSSGQQVGLVEWRSSAIGRKQTVVKALTLGTTLTMKTKAFGTKRIFGIGLGDGKDVKWVEKDGAWEVCALPME